jgi:hypothetical protein
VLDYGAARLADEGIGREQRSLQIEKIVERKLLPSFLR